MASYKEAEFSKVKNSSGRMAEVKSAPLKIPSYLNVTVSMWPPFVSDVTRTWCFPFYIDRLDNQLWLKVSTACGTRSSDIRGNQDAWYPQSYWVQNPSYPVYLLWIDFLRLSATYYLRKTDKKRLLSSTTAKI